MNNKDALSRRKFVQGSLAGLAVAGVAGSTSLYGCSSSESSGQSDQLVALEDGAGVAFGICNVNCGGNCVFKWRTKDDKILFMEADNTGDPETGIQARPCLRGRSMRRWINSPDRLQYPMKRVGKRGEAKFERITWDEATDIIAEKLKYTIENFGNEAIHLIYATGMYSLTGNPSSRLLNLVGGYLPYHFDYSTHMISPAMEAMYGPMNGFDGSSYSVAEKDSDLIVMIGNSPAETRMGGANACWDYTKARAAVLERGGQVVHIDYRLNETASGTVDEWIAIRPGTDAALVCALAHEFITNDKVNTDFLDKYCVGYSEETLPESAKGKNKSYYDYIMGKGYDKIEKTAEWAAEITQIPAEKIKELAKLIYSAKAPFVVQGWGSQRHTNGEDTSRAICMIPVLLGKVGIPGTNSGVREAMPSVALVPNMPAGTNKVKATIPAFMWPHAIEHGKEMTPENSGLRGADKLGTDLKFIWNYAGNCITNQHGDINATHDLLVDDTKCEFILVWDTVMTDSAKYADLLLPDAMRSEQLNAFRNGYSEYYTGITVGGPAQSPKFENRSSYDVMAEVAEKMGVGEEFTEGRTHDEWVEYLYTTSAQANPKLPSWEEIKEQGVYKTELPDAIGLSAYVSDPSANPLTTPSGKIEIYSETLDGLNETWDLNEGEVINPIPVFSAGYEGYGSVTDEFPLYGTGFHHKSRVHSSYVFIPEINDLARPQMWINPIDANPRDINTGDVCEVKSPSGTCLIEAKVTTRIIPGTIAFPQGSWHNADMNGDRVDKGGCVNTLTAYRPTALGKGNGTAHTYIAQVKKA